MRLDDVLAGEWDRVERTPLSWDAAGDREALVALLRSLAEVAGGAQACVLSVSNVTVEEQAASQDLPAGDYVAVTVRNEGSWGADARWPGEDPTPPPVSRVVQTARAAGALIAYSRRLAGGSSLTVLLPRAGGR